MPTVLHRLAHWAQESPGSIAQRYKEGSEWKAITAKEFCDRVYHLALYLESRGIKPSDIGAILSYNCPQWVQSELAMVLLGGKSAGLYPNSTPKDIQYILNQTEAAVLSVQNKEYFHKISGGSEVVVPEKIRLILVYDGDTSISPKAVSFATALEEGRKLAAASGATSLNSYISKIDPQAGAYMIYTSGTTGNPKGAILSHDNLAYTSDIVIRNWKLPYADGSMFSFLPLCHVAEQLQNVGVGITQRYTVSYCSKFENVSLELPEVQPTLLLCVPRLWEKMMEGVQAKVRKGKGLKKHLAVWALGVGERVARARYSGRSANPVDLVQLKIADRLVLKKIRHALGLSNSPLLASGAAALAPHISRWFRSLGLEILEDYGQTESTGVICMTLPGVECAGTVGKPVPGTEFLLAEDGEILTRGRHVFLEYFKNPESTAETLRDGWLHTGDLGEWTPDGMLKIRGRKKEILKTSGGKMVAPLPIEERLKAADIISQVCMVGDGRKYLSALITLSESTLADFVKKSGGAGNGHPVVSDRSLIDEVQKYVDQLNQSLASFEQIKRFAVLNREFSINDGEMTPTLKMKRDVIEARFKEVIDQLYH